MKKWDVSNIKSWTWRDLPVGATIPVGGNADDYETGGWRSERPVLILEKCTHCMLCWIFCPDSSVIIKDEKMTGFDMVHCKGCGICAKECPTDAIVMESEEKFRHEGDK